MSSVLALVFIAIGIAAVLRGVPRTLRRDPMAVRFSEALVAMIMLELGWIAMSIEFTLVWICDRLWNA